MRRLLLALAVAFCLLPTSAQAIALVQQGSNNGNGLSSNSSPMTCTFGGALQTGNHVVVVFRRAPTGTTSVTAVTDGASSNTYAQSAFRAGGIDPFMDMWATTAAVTHTNTVVSVAFSGSSDPNFAWVWCGEFSALDSGDPLRGGYNGGAGDVTGNTNYCPTVTATAGDLVVISNSRPALDTFDTASDAASNTYTMADGNIGDYSGAGSYGGVAYSGSSGNATITAGLTAQHVNIHADDGGGGQTVCGAFKPGAAPPPPTGGTRLPLTGVGN